MRRRAYTALIVALALVGLTTLSTDEAAGHAADRLSCFVGDLDYLGQTADGDHAWRVTTTFVNDRNRDVLMHAVYELEVGGTAYRHVYREVRGYHSANKTRRFFTESDQFDWELAHCHH